MHGLFHRAKDAFHRHPIDRLGDANGLLTGIALYPQVFHLVMDHSTDGLSPATFFIIGFTSVIWLAYAIHRRVVPLMMSSTMNLLASGLILGFIFFSPRWF